MSVPALEGPVELAAPGGSEASGLAVVAAGPGAAPAGVVAFGDMLNDLPTLAWAGVVGPAATWASEPARVATGQLGRQSGGQPGYQDGPDVLHPGPVRPGGPC